MSFLSERKGFGPFRIVDPKKYHLKQDLFYIKKMQHISIDIFPVNNWYDHLIISGSFYSVRNVDRLIVCGVLQSTKTKERWFEETPRF